MLSLLRLSLPLALVALAGCPVWEPLASCAEFDACSTTDPDASGGSSGSTVPTTSAGGGVQTVTGDDEGTTSSPDTATGVETDDTGEPAELPEVLTFKLQPDPITANGPINVVVTAIHAEGVRMETGLGDMVELTPEAGKFVGEIPVLSGLLNGPHSAFLTPWKAIDGAAVPAPYEVALPEPGTEKKYETNDLIGAGQVIAMATLPTGEPVEFGNHSPDGEQHCFLRMRGKDGFWALADVVDVLPDTPCAAVDLKIDDHGVLFVVFHQISNNSTRWRLMKIPAWGESPQHMELGAKDETAVALAHHESGAVAVCGTEPTGQIDKVDAMARIIRPGLATEMWAGDYRPTEMAKQHRFVEQTQDCVFVGDTLVLVGAANGLHENELQFRDRLFILRLDSVAQTAVITVPPPGDQPQSGAQAVDTDDEGNLILAAYTCDDDCKPTADLRIYDEGDTLKWQASLGTFPTKQFAAQDLVWSPAGYFVVATGGLKGDEAAFTVRAFSPSQEQALWTYTHSDLQVLQVALALAIGNYGEVFAGGFGANGFPAFASIWG